MTKVKGKVICYVLFSPTKRKHRVSVLWSALLKMVANLIVSTIITMLMMMRMDDEDDDIGRYDSSMVVSLIPLLYPAALPRSLIKGSQYKDTGRGCQAGLETVLEVLEVEVISPLTSPSTIINSSLLCFRGGERGQT